MLLLLTIAAAQDYGVPPDVITNPVQAGGDIVTWAVGGSGGATVAALMGYLFRERIGSGIRAFMGHEAVPAVADPAAAVPAEGAPVISPDIEARLQRADEMLSEVRAAVSLLTRADPDTGAPLLHPGTNRKMLREVAARQDQIRDLLTEIRGLLRDTTRATDQQRATVEAMRGEVNSLREEVRSVIR